jgi:mRNA interferase RelE/StbE
VAWRIEFSPSAIRDFRKLPRSIQIRLAPRIDRLADDPRPPGAKKLNGVESLWRIRAGDYEVVYEVRDRVLLTLVVRVAHPHEAYR